MGSKIILGVGAVVLMVPVLIAASISGVLTAITGDNGTSTLVCTPHGAPPRDVPDYDAEQIANATTIVDVGQQLGVPEAGWIVAIATALQESRLRNLDYGDRDSLGLFQQRPSMGWGTEQQIMDPRYAATQFFQHLQAIPTWHSMSVNDAAQAVQASGTPDAYAQHESDARAIVAAVSGMHCTPAPRHRNGNCDTIHAPTPAATTAINYACGQRGLPYV